MKKQYVKIYNMRGEFEGYGNLTEDMIRQTYTFENKTYEHATYNPKHHKTIPVEKITTDEITDQLLGCIYHKRYIAWKRMHRTHKEVYRIQYETLDDLIRKLEHQIYREVVI